MYSIKQAYKDLNKKIISKNNIIYKDDDDKILECMGNFFYIDDPLDLKYKAKYENIQAIDILKKIKNGDYELDYSPIKSEALYEYVNSLNNAYELNFVYSYPNRLVSYFGINQLHTIVNRLKNNPGSNRAIAITYDPKKDYNLKDIPCLQLVQITIRDSLVDLHCFFRSNDAYGGFYSNMFFLTYLLQRIIDELNKGIVNANYNMGGIFYHSSSSHIYYNDIKEAKKLIKG